jgi:hypothetical protein
MGYSFPGWLFVAAPGALDPVRDTCGWDPDRQDQHVEAQTIAQATAWIDTAVAAGYEGIVYDDWTFVVMTTFSRYDESPEAMVWSAKRGELVKNAFYAQGRVKNDLLAFREKARYARCGIVLNSWLQPPMTSDEGVFTPGGPQVPIKSMINILPSMANLTVMCSKRVGRSYSPWPGVYVCDQSRSDYILKNRNAALPVESPMNLGEILRYQGYDITRHPALPWQGGVVDTIARELWGAGTSEDGKIGSLWYDRLLRRDGISVPASRSEATHIKHVAWTMRDALDRVTLWRAAPTADTVRASFGFGSKP